MSDVESLRQLAPVAMDYVGFIFYEKSKRFVGEKMKLLSQIPLCIKTKRVGVFVNEKPEKVIETLRQYQLDIAQLHGNETPADCEKIRQSFPVIKAFNVDADFDFETLKEYEAACDYFLFDAKGKLPGGNNISYDWNLLNNYSLQKPFFLSGGIQPNDAEKIKAFTHPAFHAVDINSGFEVEAGRKDVGVVVKFLNEI